MRAISRAVVLVALAIGASAAQGSQTSEGPLNADAAVREALTANREFQAARQAIDAARGRRLQAGRLDNPELGLGYADDFAFGGEGERSVSVELAQRFPVTARLARAREVASREVAIAEAEVREFARTLIAEVLQSFYSVRALDERIAVQRELVASVKSVERATGRRLESAEASPAEVGLLRIERLRLAQEVERLERDREIAAAKLVRLLGRSSGHLPALAGELDPHLAGATASGARVDPERRPDLIAASQGIERADADRALARAEVWEPWTLGLGYDWDQGEFDDPIGTKRDSFVTLGLTVPIPLWNRQQGRIAEAEAEIRRARRTREALGLRAEEEVRTARARVSMLRASVDAYAAEILPEATRTQDLFERGYQQGLVGVGELLQAQRQYNESRARYLELLGELRQAAIEFEAATGRSPHLDELYGSGGSS